MKRTRLGAMRKRTGTEVEKYFHGQLTKGDVVIHKIRPYGSKKYVVAFSAKVSDRPMPRWAKKNADSKFKK
jgi:hypothetical protein